MFTVTSTDSKKRSSNLALSHHDRNTIHDHTWMNDVARTRKKRVEKQRVPNDTTMKKEKGMASQQKNNVTWKQKGAWSYREKKNIRSVEDTWEVERLRILIISNKNIFSTISSSGFLMSIIRRKQNQNTTHKHKEHSQLSKQHKKSSLSYHTLLMSIQHQRLS